MTEKDTNHIDYKALYEQVMSENEKYRERIAKIRLMAVSLDTLKYTMSYVLRNRYFWLGYVTAIIVMFIIGLFEERRK